MIGHEDKFIIRLFNKNLTQNQKTKTSIESFTNFLKPCNKTCDKRTLENFNPLRKTKNKIRV